MSVIISDWRCDGRSIAYIQDGLTSEDARLRIRVLPDPN